MGRTRLAWASALLLVVATSASAANRVNVMPDRQVRPGVSLPVFGSADGGTGLANGQSYEWIFVANPDVAVATDGLLTGVITNDRFIVENVTFTLLNGSTREPITARLRVNGDAATEKSVVIDIVAPADAISDTPLENLAVDVNIAIANGLRAMYLDQVTTPGATFGRWNHGNFNDQVHNCGTTAFAIWAFANSGHRPTNSVNNDIYSEWVQRAVDWVLAQAFVRVPPIAGAAFATRLTVTPDGNGNNRGLALCGPDGTQYQAYASPTATTALIAAYSANPGLVRASAPFAGDSYMTIVQDGIDWISASQEDDFRRGGWRYTFDSDADTSADSWNYVALEGFEAVFGGTVLEDVKREAEIRINGSQSQGAPVGQFGYSDTSCLGAGCNGTTAGGLSGLVMVSRGGRVGFHLDPGGSLANATFPSVASRKAAAVSHLGANWHVAGNTWTGNMPNFYAMWTSARAYRLNGTTQLVNQGTTFNWESGEATSAPGVVAPPGDPQEGYFPFLGRTQQTGANAGRWAATVNTGNWTQMTNTAWGVLVLQPRVFPPPCEDDDNDGICNEDERIICDVDNNGVGDGDVDNTDIALIRARSGQAASGPNDPFDPNRDGVINVADQRFCALRRTPPPQ